MQRYVKGAQKDKLNLTSEAHPYDYVTLDDRLNTQIFLEEDDWDHVNRSNTKPLSKFELLNSDEKPSKTIEHNTMYLRKLKMNNSIE